MTIPKKFNLGDKVWFWFVGATTFMQSGTIVSISTIKSDHSIPLILYTVYWTDSETGMPQCEDVAEQDLRILQTAKEISENQQDCSLPLNSKEVKLTEQADYDH